MKHSYFKGVLCAFLFMLLSAGAFAQKISGKLVAGETGETLPGASLTVKGTNRGTVSDAQGMFTIEARTGETLVVNYVGYETLEVPVTGASDITITLNESSKIKEVVVTALGFKKEKARLGYAVQDVKGEDVTKAREPNVINSLTGKVAGLVVGGSSELLGAPSISLRGSNPIFVVDGVPVNSDTWNISADDIETYTVLKGPAAAALYGFRSKDGVIMITTKKGSKDKRGVSVEFNSSQMFEYGFNAIPEVQDQYGPGDHGRYAFVDGRGGGTNDGDYDIWGPRFEGQNIPQYDSPIDPATGKRIGTPWVARGKDNLQRFLRPGFLSTNNIAVSTSTDKVDMRYSTSFNYQQGMVPNTQLSAANFNISSGIKFNDRVRLDANLNYNRQFTDNIPDVNYGPNSMIYNIIIWGGADWDIDQLKNYWQPGKEGVQQIYAEYQRYNNPWFLAKEWLRGHYKTDIYGQTALTWTITPGLSLKARTAITSYDIFRDEKFPYSATVYGREEARGDYREDKRNLFENNTDVYLNFDKQITDDISLVALAGGNLRTFHYSSSFTTTNYLNVPGIYNFTNSANPLWSSNYTADMQVQSGYYSVDLGFRSFLFLTHTGRVDHLSTLPKNNNTFFYPSLSGSVILSQLFDMGPVSFLKVRGSYANVKEGLTTRYIGVTPGASYPLGYGSYYNSTYDGPSYSNASVYSNPIVNNGQVGSYYTNTIANSNLSPSSRTNYEAGLEAKFLNNRLGVDVTYFQYIDGPQIFSKPISEASGYSSQLVNAVKTKKAGFEVSATASPFKNKDGFSWDVLLNWSTFKETLLELPEGTERLYGYYKKGDRLDGYYDSGIAKTQDGQEIHDASGRVIRTATRKFLGYSNPDWVWAAYNKFSWKNLSLGIQFDGRVGGVITDYIKRQTYRGGRNIETTEGAMGEARYQDWLKQKAGLDLNPQQDGNYVGEGVKLVSGQIKFDQFGNISNYNELTFAKNDIKTYLQDYISRKYSQAEANLISKTFAKLREVTITYQLPSDWFKNSRIIRQANVSLVGRNLLYFAERKDIDLDQYIGTNYSSLQSPTAKRYGININITF
ncbi:MAG: SusC/RagA family TonB-linked outer membrane protein [Bacteroidetes bacterium]|nr:SusC/RagA family TonB-linked outer membrane protein [Bacteroidota bacterium]